MSIFFEINLIYYQYFFILNNFSFYYTLELLSLIKIYHKYLLFLKNSFNLYIIY